jgi:hypothetical protein
VGNDSINAIDPLGLAKRQADSGDVCGTGTAIKGQSAIGCSYSGQSNAEEDKSGKETSQSNAANSQQSGNTPTTNQINDPPIERLDGEIAMAMLSATPSGRIAAAFDGILVRLGLRSAARGVANFSRELRAADLGIKGAVQELKGTFALKDGVATVRVDMIRGTIENPLQVVRNLTDAARASGATSLRIEGTLANDRLYNILVGRYGLTSNGATDVITIGIK